ETLHVERGLALALGAVHALVIGPRQQHVLEPAPELVRRDLRRPGTQRVALHVEDAHEAVGVVAQRKPAFLDVGPRRLAGLGEAPAAEIRLVARACARGGNVQVERVRLAAAHVVHQSFLAAWGPTALIFSRTMRSAASCGGAPSRLAASSTLIKRVAIALTRSSTTS